MFFWGLLGVTSNFRFQSFRYEDVLVFRQLFAKTIYVNNSAPTAQMCLADIGVSYARKETVSPMSSHLLYYGRSFY